MKFVIFIKWFYKNFIQKILLINTEFLFLTIFLYFIRIFLKFYKKRNFLKLLWKFDRS